MKKVSQVIVALCLIMSIAGCKAPKFFLGMTEQDFLSKNRGVKLLETADDGISVYKKTNYPFGAPPDVTFFHFVNGKLGKVDKGIRRPDVLIENKH